MMIAVVLSSNINRMIKDNVLVRKPVGIEAAGSMNILFTDKTGTLTEGKMGVSKIILPSATEADSFSALTKVSQPLSELYALSCFFNTSSALSEGKAVGGNATEQALLASVAHASIAKNITVSDRLPFNSDKKFSAVTLSGDRRTTLFKGAPDVLLPFVRYAYEPQGRTVSFAPLAYDFRKRINGYAAKGGRVLIIAESAAPCSQSPHDLTLICAVLLSDKIKSEAPAAVAELQGAGIQVVMITGDGKETAESIARETGILSSEHNLILTGEELSRLSDSDLNRMLPRLAVVSRALPSHKSRLVRIAQGQNLVVGMTGDGINDAPALKTADIGFAMGGGTHVAKEAGDIIILDGNLSSISKATLYGRNIFKSIRKFITLQLTMNFCALGVSMIGPFVGIEAPVTVAQMLWINIIMDTLGGLAFAGEAPLPSYMKERPKRRDEPILNGYMINQILLLGGSTVALCMFFLLSPHISSHFRYTEGNLCLLTAFFALFIFTSVLNCFNCRTDRLKLFSGIGKNPTFIFIMLSVSLIQLLFVYLGGNVLRTMPLTPNELGFTLLISLSVIPIELLRKLILRLFGKKSGF